MRKYKSTILVASLFLALLVIVAVIISLTNKKNITGEKDICIDVNMDGEKGSLEIRIINNEETAITCDLSYEIEVYKNNKWSLYQTNENTDAIGIAIQAHDQYIQTVTLSDSSDCISGVYRVVKTIRGNQYFSNEFQID